MKYIKHFGWIVLVIFFFGVASPLSYAQSRISPDVFRLNQSGSYLGIQMDDVTAANMSRFKLSSEKGVIVSSVVKSSPAADAGLQEEDVILEYAGMPVWSASQFSRLVSETPLGRKVELAVMRDGKRIILTATIGTRNDRRAESREEYLPWDRFEDFFNAPDFDRNDRNEPVKKPRLGLTLQPLTDQLAEYMGVPDKKGVLVAAVREGSPSFGNIKPGDVIIAADNKSIDNPEDLTRYINRKSEGNITLKVIRDKKEISVVINLPKAPAEEGKGIKL
jgi:serine protease Do